MQRQLKTIWGTNFAGVCRIWRRREVRVRLAAHPGEGAERFIFECRAHGKCSREIAVEHLCQKSRKTWKVYLCISTPHIYLTCTWKCLFFFCSLACSLFFTVDTKTFFHFKGFSLGFSFASPPKRKTFNQAFVVEWLHIIMLIILFCAVCSVTWFLFYEWPINLSGIVIEWKKSIKEA